MSSRFDNLIKLVVDRFHISEYNILLTEALSLKQIEDELKEKNVDITEYNPKHYLFLLALFNSNLNLDVYNQIITSIKDQGLLTRIMSQTVDRKSNTPTVDADVINKVLRNSSNIPELNSILNSIGTGKKTDTDKDTPKEYREGQSPAERYLAASRKMVKEYLSIMNGNKGEPTEFVVNTLLDNYISLLQPFKEKYPEDRLLQNNVYLMALTNMLHQSSGEEDYYKATITNFDKLKQILEMYFNSPELVKKNIIFNEPYKDDINLFANYLHKYNINKQTDVSSSEKAGKDETVYKDEDVSIFKGTVESHAESITRCIKYGKGAKHGLCISTKNPSGNYYSRYRLDPEYQDNKMNLTTYFVYINKPEDVEQYGANGEIDFFLIDAYNYRDEEETTYQLNIVSPNQERKKSKEELILKYPILQKAFENNVFTVLKTSEKEKEEYKSKKLKFEDISSGRDLIIFALYNNASLQGSSSRLETMSKKFPETFDYAFELILQNNDDAFHDDVEDGSADRPYDHYIAPYSIKEFISSHPRFKKMTDKYLDNSEYNNVLRDLSTPYNTIYEHTWDSLKMSNFSDKLKDLIPKYISYKLRDVKKRDYNISDSSDLIVGLVKFLDANPELKKQHEDTIQNYKDICITNIQYMKGGLNDHAFNNIKRIFPDKSKEILEMYLKGKVEQYQIDGESIAYIDNYDVDQHVFAPLSETIKQYPDIEEQYKEVRKKYKLFVFEKYGNSNLKLDAQFFAMNELYSPEYLEEGLDIYIKAKIRYLNSDEYDPREDPYTNNSYDDEDNRAVLDDPIDGVFNYMGESFREIHKEFLKRYDKLRIKSKYNLIDKLKTKQLLGNYFFYQTELYFPEQLKMLFDYYVSKKIDKIENYIENYDDGSEDYKRRRFNNGDIHGFIFEPLKSVLDRHPDFVYKLNDKQRDYNINYVIKFLTELNYSGNTKSSYDVGNNYATAKQLLDTITEYKENKVGFLDKIITKLENDNADALNSLYGNHVLYNVYMKIHQLIFGGDTSFYEKNDGSAKKSDEMIQFERIISKRKNKIIKTFCQDLFIDVGDFLNEDASNMRQRTRGDENILDYLLSSRNTNGFFYLFNTLVPNTTKIVLAYIFDNISKIENVSFDKVLKNLLHDPNYDKNISTNSEYKNLIYKIIKTCNFSDEAITSSKSYLYNKNGGVSPEIINYVYLFKEFEKNINEDPLYNLLIEKDNKSSTYVYDVLKNYTEKVETRGGIEYNVITKKVTELVSLLNRYQLNPPDLSKFIFQAAHSIDLNKPIRSLKWLPKQFGSGSFLTIESINLNEIDFIPSGIQQLKLIGVNIPENFKIQNGNYDSIETLELIDIKNLQNLKEFNKFKKLSILGISHSPNFSTLEQMPVVSKNIYMHTLDKLNSFKGMHNTPINTLSVHNLSINNFIGVPKNINLVDIGGGVIQSFKGLPKSIKKLNITSLSTDPKKMFPRREYRDFPEYVEDFTVADRVKKVFLGKLKDSFPRLGGESKIRWFNTSSKEFSFAYKKYVDKITKKRSKNLATKRRVKAAQAKRAEPLSREEEIENIEKQQDKVANKEKIKRLRKEDLELVAPFNVLLEGILNTIKNSFKVYK